MDQFLNLENGVLSVNTYRLPNAAATTEKDIIQAYEEETGETLTASVINAHYYVHTETA